MPVQRLLLDGNGDNGLPKVMTWESECMGRFRAESSGLGGVRFSGTQVCKQIIAVMLRIQSGHFEMAVFI